MGRTRHIRPLCLALLMGRQQLCTAVYNISDDATAALLSLPRRSPPGPDSSYGRARSALRRQHAGVPQLPDRDVLAAPDELGWATRRARRPLRSLRLPRGAARLSTGCTSWPTICRELTEGMCPTVAACSGNLDHINAVVMTEASKTMAPVFLWLFLLLIVSGDAFWFCACFSAASFISFV